MRSSLFPSLIECLRANFNRKQPRVRVFEIGRCFAADGAEFAQPEKLGGLAYGSQLPEQWGAPLRPVDFFDVKADTEALFAPRHARFVATTHPALHPGRAARIVAHGVPIGWLGELHPQWQQRYELPQAPVLFEMDLAALLRRKVPQFHSTSRFPVVRRDLALVVDEAVPAGDVLEALRAAPPSAIQAVDLFDVYQGKGVEFGKKSLAFRVLLQDTQKTLTDLEVDLALAELVEKLQQRYGAELRT